MAGAASARPLCATGKMCRVKPAAPDQLGIVDRRTVLRGGLVIGAGALVIGASSACDNGPTPNEITATALLPLARSARSDAAAARTLVPRLPAYSVALAVVADQRDAHATALSQEVQRLDSDIATQLSAAPSGSPTSGSGSASAAASAAPTPDASTTGTIDDLRSTLRASTRAAHDAAVSLKGYSAGLAGSVSASVATLVEVQLA